MTTWKPTREQSQFIKRYAEVLGSGDAALFAGAGLSRAAGYVDWRALLKEIAIDLDPDIDRESDLVALAQYHLNEKRTHWRDWSCGAQNMGKSQGRTGAVLPWDRGRGRTDHPGKCQRHQRSARERAFRAPGESRRECKVIV
uniref:Uncharacterized protein n=1 Tax=Candidatus Kentrum sp. LPFa TaxID=2126335 RepID=A0A450XBP4_9GAMM|nr:MAG: hypothetical protein BECKLPF1236A_GA0070988_100411 [Candidatus Kentron sp. LPFa]VFK26697.1 MAG: hypothetical protein BECKLPF1236C_GA0070990_100383 [Candidatus Kentron sp. LPFa]